jgi:A/G-specific adenine glycosylase
MLQQTTVQTVLPRYGPFLRRFPTVRALAAAREDSVLAAWSGLGYYARARNLHRAAGILLERHGGKLPDDVDQLRDLPGMGEYMSQAVAAIAFGRATRPMEANIRRVVSRLFATPDPEEFLRHVIDPKRPGDSIAALFDLGQTVCRPKAPHCGRCPLERNCRARRAGTIGEYPRKKALPPIRDRYVCAAAIPQGGKYWLQRRKSSWLSGLWEFPAVEAASRSEARRRFRERHGSAFLVGTVSHTVVRKRLRIEVYRSRRPAVWGDGRWMTIRQVREGAAPSLTKKIAAILSSR